VSPGFVDLHHHVSSGGGDINDMVAPTNPELRTLDLVRPSAEAIREALAGGITTTLFIPGSGTNVGGFGVLLKMTGGRLEDMVLRHPGAMKVAQGYNPERRSGDLGATRMGMHDLLTGMLERGKAYADAWRAFEAGTANERPAFVAELEQLRLVFDRKIPVLIHTAGPRDCVATARMFQEVFGTRMVLSHGCFNGQWAARDLARRKTPVNLGPRAYDVTPDGSVQGIAAGYWSVGCTDLSLNTDAPVVPAEQLPLQAAMAARLGLPYTAALRAVTIVPARQIGIEDRVGSLAPGKDADFIVTAGDPIDPRFPVEQVFVEGRLVHQLGDVK
jgi:imidazolonepropionase-like amidohydrolase